MNYVHVDDLGIIVRDDTIRNELREQVGDIGLMMFVGDLLWFSETDQLPGPRMRRKGWNSTMYKIYFSLL
jgi:hypothetical protein